MSDNGENHHDPVYNNSHSAFLQSFLSRATASFEQTRHHHRALLQSFPSRAALTFEQARPIVKSLSRFEYPGLDKLSSSSTRSTRSSTRFIYQTDDELHNYIVIQGVEARRAALHAPRPVAVAQPQDPAGNVTDPAVLALADLSDMQISSPLMHTRQGSRASILDQTMADVSGAEFFVGDIADISEFDVGDQSQMSISETAEAEHAEVEQNLEDDAPMFFDGPTDSLDK